MMLRLATLLLLAAVSCDPACGAAPYQAKATLNIVELMRSPEIGALRMSRDGTRLVVTSDGGDRGLITVLDTTTLKPLQQWRLPEGQYAQQPRWVSAREFVFRTTTSEPRYGLVSPPGPLNLLSEGRDEVEAFAMRPDEQILAVVPGKDPAVLVEGVDNNRRALFRIDLHEDDRDLIATGPGVTGQFVVDATGAPRYFFGQNHRLESTVFERQGDDWKVLHETKGTRLDRVPQRIARDGRRVYFHAPTAGGTIGLHLYDPATDEFTLVSSDARYDVASLLPSADGLDVVGVGYEGDRPRFHFPDGKHPDALLYKHLMRAFPDHALVFIDITEDGNRVLFRANSDRDPGQIYVFDRKTGEARFLMAVRPWIDPERMAAQLPVRIKARDGTELDAYLWLPANGKKDLPLVVRPHGGPHGIRDQWGFDEDAQILAGSGYAVLAVNFRGSGGYGPGFEEKGHRAWGRAMIDDLTDATRWAVAEGYAAPDRVCIYGVSYGGYAALMSVVREPSLYRCAAGMSGVYDIRAMFRHDRRRSDWMGNYFDEVFPEEMSEREWQSPSLRAAEIKVPVLLAHGTGDLRVPTEQYQRMRRALKAAGNAPVEMLVEGEGHGFRSIVNRAVFYSRLNRLLDKNIGRVSAATRKD